MEISDYIPPLSVVLFCTLSALVPAQTVGPKTNLNALDCQRAEVLRDRLKLVDLQRQRWAHLIATQEALTCNPEQLSRLATEAADG